MAKAKENVRTLTPGQQTEFEITLLRNIPWDVITPEVLRETGKAQKKLQDDLRKLFEPKIPEVNSESLRTVVMRKGVTVRQLVSECETLFPIEIAHRLDSIAFGRPKDQTYEISFLNKVEGDEHLRNKSANDLWSEGIQSITLEERLQMEIDFFKETRQHLDSGGTITLCAGSRYIDCYVPTVGWYGDCLSINWADPYHRNPNLRARQVIS